MKLSVIFLPMLAMMSIIGCASQETKPVAKSVAVTSPVMPQTIVTPDNSLTAKVVSYNSVGRFVVLSFPIGKMPRMDQNLFLYRAGLKVAEIKITGPQRDNN